MTLPSPAPPPAPQSWAPINSFLGLELVVVEFLSLATRSSNWPCSDPCACGPICRWLLLLLLPPVALCTIPPATELLLPGAGLLETGSSPLPPHDTHPLHLLLSWEILRLRPIGLRSPAHLSSARTGHQTRPEQFRGLSSLRPPQF